MNRKSTILIIIVLLLTTWQNGHAQNGAEAFAAKQIQSEQSAKTVPLKKALTSLEKTYNVSFMYQSDLLDHKYSLAENILSGDLYSELDMILQPHDLRYTKVGNRSFVIMPDYAQEAKIEVRQEKGTIKGKVVDANGKPIAGANVFLQGTTIGGATKPDGTFSFQANAGDYVLFVRVLGFKNQSVEISLGEGETVTQNFTLEEDVLGFGDVVVTGTRNEKTKIESSVAITTLPQEKLSETPARSSADVLKVVPGFYVESSGGEGGNNLFARGIPADGSFRYVQVQEDGLPVYESPELAFANIDELYRIDETMERMEAVRGGSASIFASNAPGGIINIVSKTGGPEFNGIAQVSTAYHGMLRTDVDVSGPMGDDWRFNVGGFYRYDEGLRDPGFAGNRGGQIKANITHLLDNGYVRVYGKYLNDRNVFYLPVPLQNPDSPESIPGFDANYGTMTTSDAAFVEVPDPFNPAGSVTRDLTDGMHPVVKSFQGELYLDLGDDWSLKNQFKTINVDLQFNAIFSLNNPFDAQTYAQDLVDQYSGMGITNYRYSYAYRNGTFDPANANNNGLVAETGWWYVDKPLTNYVNNFQLTKKLANHSFTGGFYFSEYTAKELWAWNDILTEVKGNPGMLNLDLLDSQGNVVTSATHNGFRRYGSNYVHHRGTGTMSALFLNDEWSVTNQLRIDAGFRYEVANFRGSVENSESQNLGNPNTLADNNFLMGTGNYRPYDYLFHEWAASVGMNYSISDKLAFFARGSKGYRMQDFETWMFGTEKGETEDVYQLEGGVKVSTPTFALFASGFFSRLDNLPFNDTVINPNTGELETVNRFANSETIGLETEAIYTTPIDGLRLNLIATIQDPKLRDFTFNQEDDSGNLVEIDYSGNQVKRIPKVLLDLKPSYQTGPFRAYVTWRYYDKRFSNNANTVELPSYNVFHVGASYNVNPMTFNLQVTNLFNEIGLTEGNPRVDPSAATQQDIYMARPILPRMIKLSMKYTF